MESNNISTKIVSILIPLILVLVVLVPITNAVSGDGEGGTRTITQEGAFMKEIKLADLDKSQEYVIADINTQTYEDRQLVFYGLADSSLYHPKESISTIVTAWYGTWAVEDEENQPETGFIISGWDLYHTLEVDTNEISIWDSDVDGEYCEGRSIISNQVILKWTTIDWFIGTPTWVLECGDGLAILSGDTVYVATSEKTDYIGVHNQNYDNQYYINEESQLLIWSTFFISSEFNSDVEYNQTIFNYCQFTQNEWDINLSAEYQSSEDYEFTTGIYEGFNYIENSPLTVTVDNSNVKVDSKWNFDILGENIDFNNYDTSFTGIIPYKVTIEGGDGGVSGPTGTLIQMIPILAILGILSTLIIPMIRKENTI